MWKSKSYSTFLKDKTTHLNLQFFMVKNYTRVHVRVCSRIFVILPIVWVLSPVYKTIHHMRSISANGQSLNTPLMTQCALQMKEYSFAQQSCVYYVRLLKSLCKALNFTIIVMYG